MRDIELRLDDRPGAIAAMGDALGTAGVNVEGGGAWVVDGVGVAHFLVADHDVDAAETALDAAGVTVVATSPVVVQRLAQDVPGQLGAFTGRLRDAGVNITTLYSDHDNQLVVVVDDHAAAVGISAGWTAASAG